MEDSTPSLRDQNRERTRLLIIEAYADLSLERGFNNFTMQDIADRVGISHRTLYRYFEHREAIVDGLYDEIAEKVYAPGSDRFLDRAGLLRHNYQVFGQYRKAMLVGSLMIEAGMLEGPGRGDRTAYMRQMVEEAAPDLNELGSRQLLGLLRVVAGAMAWARMTSEEIGLSDDEAGAASAWALEVLLEAASNRDGDFS
jgi:AcrR family transcriptional regulator